MDKVTLFWFRRDLRLDDNAGLFYSLKENQNVLPLFIFDTDILNALEDVNDPRVSFIYQNIFELKKNLQERNSDLLVRSGKPLDVFKLLAKKYNISGIYLNHDYEPAARRRDESIRAWAQTQGILFKTFKDQTLFEKEEILTDSGKPYSIYTPYKRKVLLNLNSVTLKSYGKTNFNNLFKQIKPEKLISLKDIGFIFSNAVFPPKKVSVSLLKNYAKTRDYPALANGTSHLGIHLRFGTISIRKLAQKAYEHSEVFLSELLWRDFFMQVLWHFPEVEKRSFKKEYDSIQWRNSKNDFQRWTEGRTGYPIVDAGMRELNETGNMHNRVRMITASFLCKHLLINWQEGEAYFARKLLDYDLSANNGHWQWVAGSGCDASPYFRIFNPLSQVKKFDPKNEYIKKWVPEVGTSKYSQPIIDHNEARGRCLQAYSKAFRK